MGKKRKEKKRKENPKNTWYAVKTSHMFFSNFFQKEHKMMKKFPTKNKKRENLMQKTQE